MVGFIANDWVDILTWAKTEHPHKTMEMVLSILWENLCEPIWKARNEVKHSKSSCTSQDELTQMVEQLLWHQRHQDDVLDYRHRILAAFHADNVGRWFKATRIATLTMLDNAQHFYETQQYLQTQHQSTMEDWLNSYTKYAMGA